MRGQIFAKLTNLLVPPYRARVISIALILTLLVLYAGMSFTVSSWSLAGARLFGPLSVPITGQSSANPTLISLLAPSTGIPFSTASPSLSIKLAVPNCPQPIGWSPYLVSPTDSLNRISVTYGININNLQHANCLDQTAIILPGQVIYVPGLISNTPIPSTSTPTSTAIPIIIVSNENNVQASQPNAAPVIPKPVVIPTNKPASPTIAPLPANTPVPIAKAPGGLPPHKKPPKPKKGD